MKVIDKNQKKLENENQLNKHKKILITVKNINRNIQDLQLQVPISWTFGQIIFIISKNHHQLNNYKTHGMKFMIAGNYVKEEDQVFQYVKKDQSELNIFLKIEINPSQNLAKIQQAKLDLNQQYVTNHLWDNYIENLEPFAQGEEQVQERSIQKQNIDLEILSSVFPILHEQTESLLSENKIAEIDIQVNNQPIQQIQIDLELNEDNFFAKNIVVIFLIYYFVISKFEGKVYYALVIILFLYYFIKYQDNKHTIQQRQQNEMNRQENNQLTQQTNYNQNIVTENTIDQTLNNIENQNNQKEPTESNMNKQNKDIQNLIDTQQLTKKEEQINCQTNVINKDKEYQENSIQNDDNESKNLNDKNQDTSSKEINIVDSDINKDQENSINDHSQIPTQQSLEMIKKKKQTNGFTMFFLRIKEFVQCFIMSLFPVWHIDLYIKNNPHPDTIIEEKEQKQEEIYSQNNEQNQNEININQEVQQQNNLQDQQNQQERLGILDRFQNYLENKLKQYQREEQILRQQLEQLRNERVQQNQEQNVQQQQNQQQEEMKDNQ